MPVTSQATIVANNELLIYGIVGDEMDALTSRDVIEAVDAAGLSSSDTLTVRINSPGGFVYEGLAIYNYLAGIAPRVEVRIDGLAASIASVIATAGAEIIIPENGMMMVHKPGTGSIGDADRLRKDAEQLDKVETQLAGIYARRTGLPERRVRALMREETWFTATEAVDLGFADRVAEPVQAAALTRFDLTNYFSHPPKLDEVTMTDDANQAAAGGQSAQATANSGRDPALAERQRIGQIRRAVNNANLPESFADELIDEGVSAATANARVIDKLAEHDDRTPTTNHIRVRGGRSGDDPRVKREAMAEALASRFSPRPQPSEHARQYMGYNLERMTRELLEDRGENVRNLGKAKVLNFAQTTSDYKFLFEDTGRRLFLEAYQTAPSGIRPVARERNAQDFRPITQGRMSTAPSLQKLPEAGEVKHGKVELATQEGHRLESFARKFALTWQAQNNDDLGAFADFAQRMGDAARQKEAEILWDILQSNPTMDETGKAFFHTDHGNLASTGAELSVDTLASARQAMREQVDIDGETPINIAPAYIVVGPAQETAAEQVIATIQANTVGEVNPFAGALQVVVEPRIPDGRWYVFADPARIPSLVYSYLADEPGPNIDSQVAFDDRAIEWRVWLDFGASAVDFRGAYQNPGA